MNIIRSLIFLITLSFAFSANASVVTTSQTQASIISDVKTVASGEKFWAVVHLKMQDGWHTYWKNPGDTGMAPQFIWTLPKDFKISEVIFLAPDRHKIEEFIDYGYEKDAWFLFELTATASLPENATSILSLKANWLVCNEICIPESADLSLVLPTTNTQGNLSEDSEVIKQLVAKIPQKLGDKISYAVHDKSLSFDFLEKPESNIKSAYFFPLNDNLEFAEADLGKKITFNIKSKDGTIPDNIEGIVSLIDKEGKRLDYEISGEKALSNTLTAQESGSTSIIQAIIFAFLGGIILNLMPCVFPILSLKALAIAKKAYLHPEIVRKQGIYYTLGVVLSFVVLAAIIIGVKIGGQNIGWGYQMQSPLFVALLTILLFFVGLNLSGYFEIPLIFGNLGGKVSSEDNFIGSFLTGVLAVLVATPCTAPFMATAVGFALTQGSIVIITIFVALGLGLALPFMLISLFPSLVKFLPKSGVWLLTFKQLLAFPLYLSAVWLFWVLLREAGEDYATITLIAIVIISFAIWLLQRAGKIAKIFGSLIVIITIALLAILFSLPRTQPVEHIKFSVAEIDKLRKENKAIFVDATADWCITCKINENLVLSTSEIKKAFANKNITYMVADWTHGDEEITKYLQSFKRSGVPIYVYYPPNSGEPIILPQVLTKDIVLQKISK